MTDERTWAAMYSATLQPKTFPVPGSDDNDFLKVRSVDKAGLETLQSSALVIGSVEDGKPQNIRLKSAEAWLELCEATICDFQFTEDGKVHEFDKTGGQQARKNNRKEFGSWYGQFADWIESKIFDVNPELAPASEEANDRLQDFQPLTTESSTSTDSESKTRQEVLDEIAARNSGKS